MSNNKKYYYLKLKETFFNSDEIILIESMQDGMLFSKDKQTGIASIA